MLRITVFTTYIAVPADSEGYTLDTEGQPITCYHIGQLLNKLKEGEYDQRLQRYIVRSKYYTYAPVLKELRLPRFMLQLLIDDLDKLQIPVELVDGMIVTPRPVQMYLNPNWEDRSELQTAAIAFLLRQDMPMRSLSIQTGCLTGDCKIHLNRGGNGFTTTLKRAYEQFNGQYRGEGRRWDRSIPTYTRSFLGQRIGLNLVKDIVFSGVKKVYEVVLENGRRIKCTADHRIITTAGWVVAQKINGCRVMCDTLLTKGQPKYSEALSVTYLGEEPTYDIECEEPHHNFVANGIVVHNSGKSFCNNKAMVIRGVASMIICDGLIEQWKEAILDQTLLDEKDIYVIQGSKSVKWLWMNPDYQPAVFLASHDTIRAYALGVAEPYDIMPTYQEFLATYGIGWKTVDEFHLNFAANTQIDLRSTVEDNIYLSATPNRSNSQGKAIFDRIFPRIIRFGEEEYDRYADIHMYGYRITIPRPDRLMTYKGYSHPLYEAQLAKPKIFAWYTESVLCPIVNCHFINIRNVDQKMLILVSTSMMCQVYLEHLRVAYPEMKILPFLGPDPESNLEVGDIIVSTPKSAGTGRDIKNLRTAMNTVSYSADPLARQMLGRLRKLKNGDTPVYVDSYNCNIEAQTRHARNRAVIYRELGKSYQECTL